MEIQPFYIFSVFIIIFILIVMKRFFSSSRGERTALVQKENGEKLKEFALHHFNELKKMDKVAYIRFASVYRSFSDVEDFHDVIRDLD